MSKSKKWKGNGKAIDGFNKQERFVRSSVQRNRIRDIETIVPYLDCRDKGARELILFVYRETLRQLGMPIDRRLRAVLRLNSKFCHPLSRQEALVSTCNTTKTTYCFSNDFLIFILRLTIEDEKALGLRTIRSQDMNRILRWEEAGHGRTVPQPQESQETLLAVRDMLSDKMAMTEIAATLGVSRQSLYQMFSRWALTITDMKEMTREELTAHIGYNEAECVVVDTRTPEEIAKSFQIKLGNANSIKFNPAYWGRNSNKATVVEAENSELLFEIEHPVWVFDLEKRIRFAYAKDSFEVYSYAS